MIEKHIQIILREILIQGKQWAASQKQAFYILLGALGPAVIALPFFVAHAFNEESSRFSFLVNLVLISMLSISSYIYKPTIKNLIHFGHSRSLPLSRTHWVLISSAFQLFSNFLLVLTLVVGLIIGFFSGYIERPEIILLKVTVYLMVLLYTNHLFSYFTIPFVFTFTLYFLMGSLVLKNNWWELVFLLFLSICYKKTAHKLALRNNINNTNMVYFMLRNSTFLWLAILYGAIIFFYLVVPKDSIVIHSALGCSSAILFGYSNAWAINFYKAYSPSISYLPYGKKTLQVSVILFLVFSIVIQLLIFLMLGIAFENQESERLIIFQSIALTFALISSLNKDMLRIPLQLTILLIYLMSLG